MILQQEDKHAPEVKHGGLLQNGGRLFHFTFKILGKKYSNASLFSTAHSGESLKSACFKRFLSYKIMHGSVGLGLCNLTET